MMLPYPQGLLPGRSGIILGIPAFAISLVAREDFRFAEAAEVAFHATNRIVQDGLPLERFSTSMSEPSCRRIQGTLITRLGKRIYHQMTVERVDPRGKKYYWIGGGEPDWEREEGTDLDAVDRKFVSITPLHLDMTDYASFSLLKSMEAMSYSEIARHGSAE